MLETDVVVVLDTLVVVVVVLSYGTAATVSLPELVSICICKFASLLCIAIIVATTSAARASFFIVKRTFIAPDPGWQVASIATTSLSSRV